nr:Peptidase S28 domain containing protein [Haemonchus contortus]
MIRGRPMGGFVPKPTRNEKYAQDISSEGETFQNKVDHFSNTSTAVYTQRYWYNDQWYVPGGPAFLMLGGESEGDRYWVLDGDLAWARVKYPGLVSMAVGSSGPVQAEVDFVDAKQIETFWQTVYSPYMEIVQYSGDNAVNNYFNLLMGNYGCASIDYSSFIEFMQNTTYGDAQEVRAWVWQTCTEFGYYQSTDSHTAGPFFGGEPALPVQYYIDECTAIYGPDYNSASVAAAVANVNSYYGGRDHMDSSYIILPNGNFDPWHALGKLNTTTTLITPVVIDGAAHCADMYAPLPSDTPAMTAARNLIAAQLHQWLQSIN